MSNNTGIGVALPRTEDLRLLTGRGAYAADLACGNACFAAFVRSPHAHAAIRGIDTRAAMTMPGVRAVLTGADALADGLGPIPHNTDFSSPPDARLRLPPGFVAFISPHMTLPADKARFVGEPVAVVIADSATQAEDAAERVVVDWDVRPAIVDARAAMAADAPQVWDACPGNLALTCEVGDREATERAFASAAHIVHFDGWAQRVNGTPMEPRSVLGEYDPGTGGYTLRTTTGAGVVRTRERLASILGVPIEKCRCIFGDMGGNFGTRNAFYPEYALLPWAARKIGRPVRWTASRLECFMTDYQARDLASRAELALDASGNFLGLRGENVMNLGAQTVYFWPLRKGLSMMQSVYRIPAVHFHGHAVMTHTAPTAVYRSAGRPEAVFMIERLIDIAAGTLGVDRIELRRRNLVPCDALPFTNGVGVTYDSGDYAQAMERAVADADWAGFGARRALSGARGKCRGIAVANYIEVTSGFPKERAELKVCEDGSVELVVGTMSSGQGHETTFRQLLSDWLQVPFERLRFVANDSERVSVGGGSHSGRSMRLISIALRQAVDELLSKGTALAAPMLQAPEAEVHYRDGHFIAGGASVSLWALARQQGAGLDAAGEIFNQTGGFPYGCHVCEVEVDPETGSVAIVGWAGVDDVGLAVNPLVLHGQAHGSVTQGIGQALCEAVAYEPRTAQLLSASFMDYALPRADMLPSFATRLMEVPASSHPMGIRPGGEGGTTPALGLVVNAVVHALEAYGVSDVGMPVTPERVWQAMDTARRNSSSPAVAPGAPPKAPR
jgi:carbon-monoxide dehydrogenase large subunit